MAAVTCIEFKGDTLGYGKLNEYFMQIFWWGASEQYWSRCRAIAKMTARCALYIGYSTLILFTAACTILYADLRIWDWTNLRVSRSHSAHWSDVVFQRSQYIFIHQK